MRTAVRAIRSDDKLVEGSLCGHGLSCMYRFGYGISIIQLRYSKLLKSSDSCESCLLQPCNKLSDTA